MSASPLVSVILPTHNRASLLGRAIESVLRQSYARLELIVVDDASTDATPEVTRGFSDARLRYVRLDRNVRAAAARNIGIRGSSGEFVAFQDDDDEWLPTKLERQVAALMAAPADVGLILCGFRRVEPNIVWHVGGEGYVRRLDFSRYFGDGDFSLISTPNWLVRRRVLDQVGLFDERLRSLDDWELGLRILSACRLQHLDEELWIQYQLRPANAGMAWNETLMLHDYPLLLEKHAAQWSRRTVAQYCFHIARMHAVHGRLAESREWIARSLKANPLGIKAWSFLIALYAGDGATRLVTRAWNALARVRRRIVGLVYEHPAYRGRYEVRRPN